MSFSYRVNLKVILVKGHFKDLISGERSQNVLLLYYLFLMVVNLSILPISF